MSVEVTFRFQKSSMKDIEEWADKICKITNHGTDDKVTVVRIVGGLTPEQNNVSHTGRKKQ